MVKLRTWPLSVYCLVTHDCFKELDDLIIVFQVEKYTHAYVIHEEDYLGLIYFL